MIRLAAACSLLMLCSCAPPEQPSLSLTLKPTRIGDNGEIASVEVQATDGWGKPGRGAVKLSSNRGSLVTPAVVTLSEQGTAEDAFTCNLAEDPGCSGSVRIAGEWSTGGVVVSAQATQTVLRTFGGFYVTTLPVSEKGTYWVNYRLLKMLDGTQPNFPPHIGVDPRIKPAAEPDLSSVANLLGPWLTNGPPPQSYEWNEVSYPTKMWTVGTEVALVMRLVMPEPTPVVAKIAVDNGVFVWFDGVYRFGAVEPDMAVDGEYVVDLGMVSGIHYIQLLLEDHGVTNGFRMVLDRQ